MTLDTNSRLVRFYKYTYNTHDLPSGVCDLWWGLLIGVVLFPFYIMGKLVFLDTESGVIHIASNIALSLTLSLILFLLFCGGW